MLAGLIGWLYSSILWYLVRDWKGDFAHGYFVPAFSLFVLWQKRSRLAELRPIPSAAGLFIMLFAVMVLVVGVMGAELFLSRVSFILLSAGLIVYFLGWHYFREVFFPWAFLILMIPIPVIIFNQITFPLQLLASKLAATVLPIFGVPVLREGNVINLPSMPLEVAEACSGIRSLLSLTTLAIMYGYLLETRLWIRIALALGAVPIAVAANSLRIVGTGLLVQYWDPSLAEGFFHAFQAWLVFVVSLIMLFLLHKLLVVLGRKIGDPAIGNPVPVAPADGTIARGETGRRDRRPYLRFLLAAALLAATATFLHRRNGNEIIAARQSLSSFPSALGDWKGTDVPIPPDALKVLGPGDFLLRTYENEAEAEPQVDLFLAYFPSQRAGDTIHSPKHCLPGAGWSPVASDRVTLNLPAHSPFSANRYIIAKGGDRQLVLYWYLAHDRAVASEYWAKFYLVADAMRMNRSDGSLVRFTTPISGQETPDSAQQRLLAFADRVGPLLGNYVPR